MSSNLTSHPIPASLDTTLLRRLGFIAFGFEASEQMAAVQTAMIGRMPYTPPFLKVHSGEFQIRLHLNLK
jgi:hypothetical protein